MGRRLVEDPARRLGRRPARLPTGDKVATRAASGKVINALAPHIPTLIGGSADLAPSNNTLIAGSADQQAATPAGRNLHFGVREHAMAAIANGLSTHGGFRPFVATFFVFVDYMRPAIRLAALMKQPVIYVLTHDFDRPRRGRPHAPADRAPRDPARHAEPRGPPPGRRQRDGRGLEARHEDHGRPVGLVLTRQNLPIIDRTKYAAADGIATGAYVLADAVPGHVPDVIIIATGCEVALALEAHERLMGDGVKSRVVNMASMRLFEQQNADYRESVLPPACSARLAVEAGVTFGWDRWVGDGGQVLGIDHFGASAPAGTIFKEWGFTADNVYARAKALV